MPAQNKTTLGLNQWLGNEYPKRIDFVEDNQITNDELEKRVKYTDLATDTEAGILTLNKVREIAPQPDLSPYVTYARGFRNTNNIDSFVRTNGLLTWASFVIEMWEAGTYRGKFHTNGGRAYYAVPGRNGGNFNEIMDNHDMAVRDARLNHFQALNPNNRGIEDIFLWHVRDMRLTGYVYAVIYGQNAGIERNGYVVTGVVQNTNDQIVDLIQMRALQFYRNGQWLNVPFA